MRCLIAFLLAAATLRAEPALRWERQTNSLTLHRDGKVLWTFHHDPAEGKPYFHPLALPDGTVFTDLRPADHPWHRGLWWSWKYLNTLNYWEEDRKTGLSQGRTELIRTQIQTQPDGAAQIRVSLAYRPPGSLPVLTEEREITIGAPAPDGSYRIDWRSVFQARLPVLLERTPPSRTAGGYAGLALRLGPGQKEWRYMSGHDEALDGALNGKPARWIGMEGPTGGVLFADHPSNPRHPVIWRVSPQMPYVAPSPVYGGAIRLSPGESLAFRYRLFVHAGALSAAGCQAEWEQFSALE